uniref:RCCR n=1 Tax=Arundo donax TaxID=35708 RepID=A0A0A9HJK9_ARUDO
MTLFLCNLLSTYIIFLHDRALVPQRPSGSLL